MDRPHTYSHSHQWPSLFVFHFIYLYLNKRYKYLPLLFLTPIFITTPRLHNLLATNHQWLYMLVPCLFYHYINKNKSHYLDLSNAHTRLRTKYMPHPIQTPNPNTICHHNTTLQHTTMYTNNNHQICPTHFDYPLYNHKHSLKETLTLPHHTNTTSSPHHNPQHLKTLPQITTELNTTFHTHKNQIPTHNHKNLPKRSTSTCRTWGWHSPTPKTTSTHPTKHPQSIHTKTKHYFMPNTLRLKPHYLIGG